MNAMSYNALYQGTTSPSQQLLDPVFSNLNEPLFQKTDSTPRAQNLAPELSHHATLDDDQQRHHMQHVPHHLQQAPFASDHQDSGIAQSHPLTQTATPEQPQKTNRLRKACDSCSIRKVKCDETGPPCKACIALDIPCTFDRPSRRRGPPNRHAEAIKRRRLEDDQKAASPSFSRNSTAASPTHAAQALASLSGHSAAQLSAESICPVEALELLIDDFFTYIHPLCPFPHEPSFREAWKRREDLSNKSFLALLASMIGTLVASFPRKPRLHLRIQKRDKLFPNHMELVQRCQRVCSDARGLSYLESDSLNVYDAATSYFLGLTGFYSFKWRLGRLYFGECLTILRTLGLHKPKKQSLGTLPIVMGSQQAVTENALEVRVDNITLEVGRRIFWTMLASVKSMEQFGANFEELDISKPTDNEPQTPLPVEVDDFCIYPTHTEPQPQDLTPVIAGFNASVRIFSSYSAIATVELAWSIDATVDWDRLKHVLRESLRQCKAVVNKLPQDLTFHPAGVDPSQQNGDNFYSAFAHPQLSRDPAASLMSPASRPFTEQSAEHRRRTQCDIHKSNIYVSSLATRSYIVEKYWSLRETYDRSRSQQSSGSVPSPPDSGIAATGVDGTAPAVSSDRDNLIEIEMRQERESIVKDLLVVLSNIEQVNMEPNADSFTMKVRSIAAALLQSPEDRKGPIELQIQEPLSAFLQILTELEQVSPANSDTDQPEDQVAELKAWADLKDCQMKFAQQGGLLDLS